MTVKYGVLIIDGAAGWPLPEKGGRTSLQLARLPNLNALAREGRVGLARTIPTGMEPSSACACLSILGYDPKVYYRGRAGIEARSMGIPTEDGDVVFRCNLVAVRDGRMWSYSSGYISTEEARELITALNEKLGNERIRFYPGVSYRHILRIKDGEGALSAKCTPPHDIPDKSVAEFLPRGPGSDLLRDIMVRSEVALKEHSVNKRREARGAIPATMAWLFWGTGRMPEMPSFERVYGLKAAMTSGVDLLRGLARMAGMTVLEIKGVTDGPDNDYAAQVSGALEALKVHDLVIIHIEAPDEAGHAGSVEAKVEAIEKIDKEVLSCLSAWPEKNLRLLVMPDHPTPIQVRTHVPDPVPFLLWGQGLEANGAKAFNEEEAKKTGFFIEDGYKIMTKLVGKA